MKKSFLYLLTLSTLLFFGCSGDKMQMLRQLEQLEATNRSGEPLLNDTLAEQLVDYFDRHGDSNERMRAKYMLGRTYFCLGELPRALETYIEAAGCADTTSEDCNYKVLSRVHAQSAVIFNQQVQPLSQLKELRLAVYYAKKGNDTLISIECLAQQADAYDFMHNDDSVIIIKKKASALFTSIHREDRAAQTVIPAVSSLVKKGQLDLARQWIQDYEAYSGNFDTLGNIEKGREVYYYIKGEYCLAINAIDSAEYLFRKELRDGKDLNNQIAGSKGLQKVFERRHNPDSIAKYATLGYELNDSAYSLSEMQTIQKFQASYNYNHHKFLAEQERIKAQRTWLVVAVIILVVLLVGLMFMVKYRNLKSLALDYRLRNAKITRRLKRLANSNPPQYPTMDDWHELRMMVEQEIPSFPKVLNSDGVSLSDMEYDVCLMIRVQLLPIEISKLKQCSPSHISNIRKRLLLKIFGKEGGSEDFDDEIGKIGL